MRRVVLFVFVFFSICPSVFAKTSFSHLDLEANGRLLIKGHSDGIGFHKHSNLFVFNLQDKSIISLGAHTEKIELYDSGRIIQMSNPWGIFRIPIQGGLPEPLNSFPSFVQGAVPRGGMTDVVSSSPDGEWFLYVSPVTAATGNLVLVHARSGRSQIVSKNINRPGTSFPASWNLDSNFFVYEKNNTLFYKAIRTDIDSEIEEKFRIIGDGRISMIQWGRVGDLYYLQDTILIRIRTADLHTRSLYAGFLETGNIAGVLPFNFDPSFDSFSISPDGTSLIFCKDKRHLFYYPLGVNADYIAESIQPYIMLPLNTLDIQVLWSEQTGPAVLVRFHENGGVQTVLYTLVKQASPARVFFDKKSISYENASISPNGKNILMWGKAGMLILDYPAMKNKLVTSNEETYSAEWVDTSSVIQAGKNLIERVALDSTRTMLGISTFDKAGWSNDGKTILVENQGRWYKSDGKSAWQPSEEPLSREALQTNKDFRVYLETSNSPFYVNIPYIRHLAALRTDALVTLPDNELLRRSNSISTLTENNGQIWNGVSTGKDRSLALAFDIYDDPHGLPFVLDVLDRYNIRATFFINGEFIRRYPETVKDLAARNHEIASMFFSRINLSDSRYTIDSTFIQRGLGRTEDEYYAVTGKELALLWHAPYYAQNSNMAAAAAVSGYKTIGRSLDPMDWFSLKDASRQLSLYKNSAEIIDAMIEQAGSGMIIPIRLGLNNGQRDDYVFNRLEILIDALVKDAYSIVSVGNLLKE